jgi:hypothetical protein
MIYIVAQNRESTEVREFTQKRDAEEFCTKFLYEYRDYGGAILLAVEGYELTLKPIEVVKAFELLYPSQMTQESGR